MRSKRLPWVWLPALCLMVAAVSPLFAEDPPKDPPKEPAQATSQEEGIGTGDLAAAWTGKKFLNSEELTLEGLRGKFVFIEFFGTG